MHRNWFAVVAIALALLSGCAAARPAAKPAAPPQPASGFLDDYTLLREGGPGDPLLVYRNPAADWKKYDRVLLEPVSLWRSGKGSLDPVPEGDLLRLAADFEAAVRRRLGAGFAIVTEPAPGVLRIRLAIANARAADSVLDVMTTSGESDVPLPTGDGPLAPETLRFVDGAAIEGEIRDAVSGELLAAGVDRRRSGAPPIATWADLDRIFAAWADRVCGRLEARVNTP